MGLSLLRPTQGRRPRLPSPACQSQQTHHAHRESAGIPKTAGSLRGYPPKTLRFLQTRPQEYRRIRVHSHPRGHQKGLAALSLSSPIGIHPTTHDLLDLVRSHRRQNRRYSSDQKSRARLFLRDEIPLQADLHPLDKPPSQLVEAFLSCQRTNPKRQVETALQKVDRRTSIDSHSLRLPRISLHQDRGRRLASGQTRRDSFKGRRFNRRGPLATQVPGI